MWGIHAHLLVGGERRAALVVGRSEIFKCQATTTTWVVTAYYFHFPLIDFLEMFGSLEMAIPLLLLCVMNRQSTGIPVVQLLSFIHRHRPKKSAARGRWILIRSFLRAASLENETRELAQQARARWRKKRSKE